MIGDLFLDVMLAATIVLGWVMIPVGFFALGAIFGARLKGEIKDWIDRIHQPADQSKTDRSS
jgi:hypothetical protein